MRFFAVTLAVLMLASCASASGVQPFSGDVLTVSRRGATGASDPDTIRGATMNDARAYCEARGQKFELTELVEAKPPFILGNFPKAEVRFRCVA